MTGVVSGCPPFDLGDGLVLRRHAMEDLDAIWALIEIERRHADRLPLWMPWIEAVTTIDEERTWLEGVIADEKNLEGCGLWIDDRFAGGVGLSWDPFGIAGELGYWISAEFEGRGYITRACRTLIDHAFGELDLHRVVIRAGVENVRSRAIPERLGFTREGVHRQEGRGSQGFYDLVCYGLLEDEWPTP